MTSNNTAMPTSLLKYIPSADDCRWIELRDRKPEKADYPIWICEIEVGAPAPIFSYNSGEIAGRGVTWKWNEQAKWLSAIPAGLNPTIDDQACAAAETTVQLLAAVIHSDFPAFRRALESGFFVVPKNQLFTAGHPFW